MEKINDFFSPSSEAHSSAYSVSPLFELSGLAARNGRRAGETMKIF